jgi:hypothetical protein
MTGWAGHFESGGHGDGDDDDDRDSWISEDERGDPAVERAWEEGRGMGGSMMIPQSDMPPLPSTFVPTFYLSESEMMADFEKTVMRIHRQCGKEYGIVKIHPPALWQRKLDALFLKAVNPNATSFSEELFEDTFSNFVGKMNIGKPVSEYVTGELTNGWAFRVNVDQEYAPMTSSDYYATAPARTAANMEAHGLDPADAEAEVDMETAERQYWKYVQKVARSSRGNFLGLYGSDVRRSLFPRKFRDNWNLNSLDSVLSKVAGRSLSIPGVDAPYLYFGSRYTTFSWHTEDVEFFSVNYHWYGATKVWYAGAPKEFYKFRRFVGKLYPDMLLEDQEFLRHKQCVIHPGVLMNEGNLSVYKAYQEPGEFIITFPHGYHGGFNQGFNINEAVNFATRDYLPYGLRADWSLADPNAVWIDDSTFRKMQTITSTYHHHHHQSRSHHPFACHSVDRLAAAVLPAKEEPVDSHSRTYVPRRIIPPSSDDGCQDSSSLPLAHGGGGDIDDGDGDDDDDDDDDDLSDGIGSPKPSSRSHRKRDPSLRPRGARSMTASKRPRQAQRVLHAGSSPASGEALFVHK